MTMTTRLLYQHLYLQYLKSSSKRRNLSEALIGAAVAFTKFVSGGTQARGTSDKVGDESIPHTSNNTTMPRVTPGKAVDLQMKNYEQLHYLQQRNSWNFLNKNQKYLNFSGNCDN